MATLGWSRSYSGAMPYNVMNFGAVGNGVTDDSQVNIYILHTSHSPNGTLFIKYRFNIIKHFITMIQC